MHEKTRYFEANRIVSWPLGYANKKKQIEVRENNTNDLTIIGTTEYNRQKNISKGSARE